MTLPAHPEQQQNRRRRGIAAFAKIMELPEQDVPRAFAARVGPVFAEEAL